MSPISDCGKISTVTDEKKMATSGHQEETLDALRFSIREKAKNSGLSSDSEEVLPSVKKCSGMKMKEEEEDGDGKRKPKIRLMLDIYKTAKHCTLEELEIRNGRTWPTEEDQAVPDLSNKEAGNGELADQGSSSSDPTLQTMLAGMGKWSSAKRTITCSKKTRKRKYVDAIEEEEDSCDDHVELSALRKMSTNSKGKRRRKLIIAESQTSDSLAAGQEHRQPGDEIVDSLNSKRVVETDQNPHLQNDTILNSIDTQFSKLQLPAENEAAIAVAGPSATTYPMPSTTTTTTVLRLMGKNIVVTTNTI